MEQVIISRETYDRLSTQARTLEEIQNGGEVLKIHVDARGRGTTTTCSKEGAALLVGEAIAARVDFWKSTADTYRKDVRKAEQDLDDLSERLEKERKSHRATIAKLSGLLAAAVVLTAWLLISLWW